MGDARVSSGIEGVSFTWLGVETEMVSSITLASMRDSTGLADRVFNSPFNSGSSSVITFRFSSRTSEASLTGKSLSN